MTAAKRNILVACVVLATLGLHAYFFWSVRRQVREGYSDFVIFYTAGTAARQGEDLYDQHTQWSIQQSFAANVSTRNGPLPYNHAPFEALVFWPLSYLPYYPAYLVWNAINVALLLTMIFLLRPHVGFMRRRSPLIWLLVALAFFPVLVTLVEGQDSILLLLVYVGAYLALQKKADLLAGTFLALGLFKFHLLLPFLVVFVFRRKGRVLAGFAATAAALTLASAALIGAHGLLAYPRFLLTMSRNYGASAILPGKMASLRGLVEPLLGSGVLGRGTLVVASIALLLWVMRAWRVEGPGSEVFALGFAANTLVTLLVGYHLYSHDLVVMLLPLLLLVNHLWTQPAIPQRTRRLLIGCCVALSLTPVYLLFLFEFQYFGLLSLIVLGLITGIAAEIRRYQPGSRPAGVVLSAAGAPGTVFLP